jgi:hypothetical protein
MLDFPYARTIRLPLSVYKPFLLSFSAFPAHFCKCALFYKRLAYGILSAAQIWLGRKKTPQQSNSDDEEG